MRILHVSSLYPPNVVGGAEQGLKTLAEAKAAAGHDVHVATLQAPGAGGERDGSATGPVTVHEVPLANVYWPYEPGGPSRPLPSRLAWHGIDTANVVMARRVARIVRRVAPDVVLTHNLQGFSTAVMPAIRRAGAPLVHVPHDYALLCPQTTLWRNGAGCGTGAQRCTGCRVLTGPRHRHAESVDAVVSVSRSLLEFHRAHGLFTDVPATVIHNALKPAFRIRDAVRPRSETGVFTFGFLGRVERSKGIEALLAAASGLERSGVRFRLRVAGRARPGYIEELRQRWPLADVEYAGYVDAPEFLAGIDTLVFPSEWMEALGNGVFEAFSQGVPVIGSDIGGIPETIDDGVNGLVFPAGDAAALAAMMRRLAAEPGLREAMGAAALEKAREYLAPRRAAEYVEFLEGVVRRAREAA